MLVYDITKQNTLQALDSWMDEIKSYISNPTDINKIIFVVFANKVDKTKDRAVDFNQGRLWAESHGCHYFETSAQSGDGVSKAFQTMFKGIIEVIETGSRPATTGTTLGEQKTSSSWHTDKELL